MRIKNICGSYFLELDAPGISIFDEHGEQIKLSCQEGLFFLGDFYPEGLIFKTKNKTYKVMSRCIIKIKMKTYKGGNI